MAISGTFMSTRAVQQPMATKEKPNSRHGEKTQPDNAWSPPPDVTGGGAPWAEPVTPEMAARGINLDLGHRWGHAGTGVTSFSRRPFLASQAGGREVDVQYRVQGAAQDAAANAHADHTSAYYATHQYSPMPQDFAGETYTIDQGVVDIAPVQDARAIIHGRPGGQFLDGAKGEYRTTGARRSYERRWAQARYSSPTLGAMYSRNSLRGVLPQVVAVPVNLPARGGVYESGIPSNKRNLAVSFTTPKLFRSPPSESETIIANTAPTPNMGDTMGVGF
jgi:hypothetical protein